MRIAISGTHCCGKSTLIDELLITHPEFHHEPEAYEAMEDRAKSFPLNRLPMISFGSLNTAPIV